MEKNSILEFNNKKSVSDVLNELLRDGAQQLIHQAVEAELSECLSQHQCLTDDGSVAFISLFVVDSSIFDCFMAITILAEYHGTSPDRS